MVGVFWLLFVCGFLVSVVVGFFFRSGCGFLSLSFPRGPLFFILLPTAGSYAISVIVLALCFSCSCIVVRRWLRSICPCSRPACGCLALCFLGSSHRYSSGVSCRALGFSIIASLPIIFPTMRSSVSGSRWGCSCLPSPVVFWLVSCA